MPYALRPAYLEALAIMLQALPETGPGAVRSGRPCVGSKVRLTSGALTPV